MWDKLVNVARKWIEWVMRMEETRNLSRWIDRGDPSRRTVDVILKYLITNLYRNTWPYVIPNQTETDIPRQFHSIFRGRHKSRSPDRRKTAFRNRRIINGVVFPIALGPIMATDRIKFYLPRRRRKKDPRTLSSDRAILVGSRLISRSYLRGYD